MSAGSDALVVLAASGVAAVALFTTAIWRRSWRIWVAGFAALTLCAVLACIEHRKTATRHVPLVASHSRIVLAGGHR